MRIALTLTLLLLGTSSILKAQVVQTPSGPLEFIGLKNWSAQQLWDSIYARYPDEGAHACMSVLREEFGFQDALVVLFPEDDSMRWVAFVSEEGDPDNPFVLEKPQVAHPLDSKWREVHDLLTQKRFLSQVASSSYPYRLKGMNDTAWIVADSWGSNLIPYGYGEELASIDSNMLQRVWMFWEGLNSEKGRDELLNILSNEGNDTARQMAALALVNFYDDMTVRKKLVEAFRDPYQSVGANAALVLQIWNQHFPAPVDWNPVLPIFRRILAGEASSHLMTVMTLAKNSSDTTFGIKLLKGNTDFVLAMLQSKTLQIQTSSHDFLQTVLRVDLGMNPEAWKEWVQKVGSRAGE
ncbi:MAG: hypothetical protein AB7H80_02390 [Candidatus Kapaibacterium sp.]